MSDQKLVIVPEAQCCISLVSGYLAVIPLVLCKALGLSFGVDFIGDVVVVVGCGFRDNLVAVGQV